LTRRLQVDEEGHVVTVFLPVLERQLHAHVPRNSGEMNRCVGGTADRRADDDGVEECIACQDRRGPQILEHHRYDPLARPVSDLSTLPIWCWNRTGARKLHSQCLRERVHGCRRAHGVAVTGGRGGGGDQLDEARVVDLTGGEHLAGLPYDRAGAGALTTMPAVEHRPHRERNGGDVDRRGCHEARRCRFVAADGEHHTIERIAVEHFDQSEIGEVAVEARGRALAGLLDGVDRKLDGNAACRADARGDAFRQNEMMAIAGREVRARLGDTDDGLAGLQLLERDAVVQVALQVKRRHVRIGRVVEPGARAQAAFATLTVVSRHFFCCPLCFLRVMSIRFTPMSITFRMASAAACSCPDSMASTMAAWPLTVASWSAGSSTGELCAKEATSAVSMTLAMERMSGLPEALPMAR